MSLKGYAGRAALLIGACLLVLNAAAQTAAPANAAETYTWSAELVSFDERSRTMTVRRLIEPHADIGGPESFSEGERVTLVWTGRSWAANVSDIVRSSEAAKGFLQLPAELVAFERDGRYVRFRVPVPEDDLAQIVALMPGEWVRAISPRSPSSGSDAVIAAGPYNTT